MRVHLVAAIALAALVTSCARQHLSTGYGRAFHGALAAQEANATAAKPPSMALDTQEASVISDSYVQSLAGKTGEPAPPPVILVAPQRGAQAQPLAPSVPRYQ
jgi:hypothetical protein